MHVCNIEIRRIDEGFEKALSSFFQNIVQSGDDRFFHPHPFSEDEASRIAHYRGKDLYYIMVNGVDIIAYGYLRGWDEGHEIPSLGIIVLQPHRQHGVGEFFMKFLHFAAKMRSAGKIMLKVYKNNKEAYCLYRRLGYVFENEEKDQLTGYFSLR